MNENNASTVIDWINEDDAPDLSTPEWKEKVLSSPVQRGRPRVLSPKKMQSFKLSQDVIAAVKASGKGFNARVEKILKEAFIPK